MTAIEVSDVAVSDESRETSRNERVSSIRWTSKFTLSRHVGKEVLQLRCNCRSLSAKQDFFFPELQHSSPFPLNMASFIPKSIGISSDGTMMWVLCVWSLCDPVTSEQSTVDRPKKPCGTRLWLRIQAGSATHWIWDCNSPSVCNLGWCGGRGESRVSHGKACFIVCLREWRIERWEKREGGDGRRWWERREVGSTMR